MTIILLWPLLLQPLSPPFFSSSSSRSPTPSSTSSTFSCSCSNSPTTCNSCDRTSSSSSSNNRMDCQSRELTLEMVKKTVQVLQQERGGASCQTSPKNIQVRNFLQGHDHFELLQDRRELPQEIMLRIFSYQSPFELFILAAVCRYWRGLALDGQLWMTFTPWSVILPPPPAHSVSKKRKKLSVYKSSWYPFSLLTTAAATTTSSFYATYNNPNNTSDLSKRHRSNIKLIQLRLSSVLSKTGPFLKCLDLRGYGHVRPTWIFQLITQHHGQSLREIRLGSILSVTGQQLQNLLSNLEALTLLDLSNLPQAVTDLVLSSISSTKLRAINLCGCRAITAYGLGQLTQRQNNLQVLKVSRLRGLAVTPLFLPSSIKHVSLLGCEELTDQSWLEMVRPCARLEKVALSQCSQLSDVAIAAIATKTLTHLDVSQVTGLTDLSLKILAQRSKLLQVLDLEGLALLTSEGLLWLRHLIHLRDVSLAWNTLAVDDETVKVLLGELSDLTRLAVDNCAQVSGESIKQAIKHPCLKNLELWDCRAVRPAEIWMAMSEGLSVKSYWEWKERRNRTSSSTTTTTTNSDLSGDTQTSADTVLLGNGGSVRMRRQTCLIS